MLAAVTGSTAPRRLAHGLCAIFFYKKDNRVWCNLLTAGRETGEVKRGCSFLESRGVSSSGGSEGLSGGVRWSQQRAGGLQLNQRHCREEGHTSLVYGCFSEIPTGKIKPSEYVSESHHNNLNKSITNVLVTSEHI